jgi:hypothetical protein
MPNSCCHIDRGISPPRAIARVVGMTNQDVVEMTDHSVVAGGWGLVYTGFMTDNFRKYFVPIGVVLLVVLAGAIGCLATAWFTGSSPTIRQAASATLAGPTIPGYDFNISISSQLPNLPIDPISVNPGRLSEF